MITIIHLIDVHVSFTYSITVKKKKKKPVNGKKALFFTDITIH